MSKKVKLVKVFPVTKAGAGLLSYFSLKDVKRGDLISVPLRKKEVPAIVVESKSATESKSELRSSEYSLKRVSEIKSPGFLDSDTIRAVLEISCYFLCSAGSILKELLPATIIEKPPKTSEIINHKAEAEEKSRQALKYKITESDRISVLQAPKEERIKFYKNLVRSEFAQKKSVFICLSSTKDIEDYAKILKKGIEKYTFDFYGKLNKKELRTKWVEVLKSDHPVLIVASSSFLLIPRRDIHYFVIEKEGSSSPGFGMQIKPKTGKSTEILSKHRNSSVILADEIIRTETHQRKTEEKISTLAPPLHKKTTTANQISVDMRKNKTIISDELAKILKETREKQGYSLLFINRLGYGLSTICQDCGNLISCPHCDTPLVLHQKTSRQFICHKCFAKSTASESCPLCGSYKLKTLGRGIEKVEEEIQKIFPEVKVFRLDSTTAKNKKEGEEIIQNYLKKPGSILLSTEMIFSFLHQKIDTVGIVSIDNLFSLPDFRINEKIFRHLLGLKDMARKNFVVQTHLPEHPLFGCVEKNNISKFYEMELSSRKALNYPPFKTFIKIIRSGKNQAQVKKEIETLAKKLSAFHPEEFPAFTPKIKGIYTHYILLRLESNTWPPGEDSDDNIKKLYLALSSLPPQWKVDVDPETLL